MSMSMMRSAEHIGLDWTGLDWTVALRRAGRT